MTKKATSLRTRWLILLAAAIVLAAAVFGAYRLATYTSANHADRLSAAALENYNRTVSTKAITSGSIQSREIVLLESITKTHGQDAVLVFRIYRLPEGADGADYMRLRAGQPQELTEMGLLTCRIVGSDPATVYDVRASYSR